MATCAYNHSIVEDRVRGLEFGDLLVILFISKFKRVSLTPVVFL